MEEGTEALSSWYQFICSRLKGDLVLEYGTETKNWNKELEQGTGTINCDKKLVQGTESKNWNKKL